MKKLYPYLLSVAAIQMFLFVDSFAYAAQGDVPGFFQVNLDSLEESTFTKQCYYRGPVLILKDAFSAEDRVYGIRMSDGSTVEVKNRGLYGLSGPITDLRGHPGFENAFVGFGKTVPRFSDCPNSLTLKYNSLTQQKSER